MKKFASVLLCAVLVFAMFAGCGGSAPAPATPAPATPAPAAPAPAAPSAPAAQQVTYPNFPVSVVVPYAAGGGTDLVTRAIVEAARDSFPRNVSVENRTGGGGAIGMVYGATAASDGSVITTITVELTTLPHMGTGATLQADQFKPVMMMNSAYSAITVKADSPWQTLEDLIEAAKTQNIRVGNSGVGAIWHLAAAALEQQAGVEFAHIPFEGAAPAVTQLLGGHIEAVAVSYPEVSAQVASGDFRVLAILAPERNANIPEVPTARENGFDVVVGTWRGLGVPAATPDEVVGAIFDIFYAASQTPGFIEFMANNNLDIDVLDGAGFAARIAADDKLFEALIAELDLA